jgi:hypothetical protein
MVKSENIGINTLKCPTCGEGDSLLECNRIYNEDCLEGMKRIPDGSVDCVICDLPYGTTACAWDSIIPLDELWGAYKRILKPYAPRSAFW